jgi:hypothetical protein
MTEEVQVSRFRVPRPGSQPQQVPTRQAPVPAQRNVNPRYALGPPMPEFNPQDKWRLLDQFWLVCHYYNPHKFESRLENFITFYNSMIGQCPNLLVIEMAHRELAYRR